MRRTVTILSSEMDGTALIRDHALARMLASEYNVQIVGFSRGGGVWPPLAGDTSVDFRPLRIDNAWDLWTKGASLARRVIEGDVIYAMKPRATSFGLGLRARRALGRPLVLDIDDWEMGFLGQSIYWEARLNKHHWLKDPLSPLFTRILDRRTDTADARTVTTSYLQRLYDGVWIPHTRDAAEFDAAAFPPSQSPPLQVLYLGAVRPHKGLGVLVDAWNELRPDNAVLRMVGTPLDSRHLEPLRAKADDSVRFEGPVAFDQVARVISEVHVVVIPQLDTRAAWGQLPTKLIEAMALGRAIITTRVGDIPMWIEPGAGLLIAPGDQRELATALGTLLNDAALRERLGSTARERFLLNAASSAVAPRLCALMDAVLNGRPWPIEPAAMAVESVPR